MVRSFDNAGVFHASGPFAGLLCVFGRVEDRLGKSGEGHAVGTRSEAET